MKCKECADWTKRDWRGYCQIDKTLITEEEHVCHIPMILGGKE